MAAKKAARSDGRIWIFLSWLSLFLIIGMMAVLGLLICVNSFRALWPAGIEQVRLADGASFLGMVRQK